MLTIAAFARLAGISAKQLRAYDGLALFEPAWVDPATGYRRYSPAQLPELRRILALRQLGMGLDEIGELARGGDLRAALERRREELERERRLVAERLAALDITVAGEGTADVVVGPLAVEAVATLVVSGSVPDAFFELESHVRDAGRRAHRPPGAIPAEALIFVPVTGPIPETDRIAYRRLPATRAACLIHRGDYPGIGAVRATLERWVAAADLVPSGPMRTIYLQFGAEPELRIPAGWVVGRSTDLVTELQLPVE